MHLQGKAYRVSVYVGEDNRFRGQPLYSALLDLLRRERAAGATVTRGTAGFGAHSRIHTASIVDLSADLPLRLEWVDTLEQVERLLPKIQAMVGDGLITIEEVQVIQYGAGNVADALHQPVSNVMRVGVATATAATPVTEIISLLLEGGYRSIPVVDENQCLVGIITDGDLLQRAGLVARLGLQEQLTPTQVHAQIANIQAQNLHADDIMTQFVIRVRDTDRLSTAIELMNKHGLKRLPVTDADRRLIGLISRIDILHAVDYSVGKQQNEQSLPRSGATVGELMNEVAPVVGPQARLEEIIWALESSHQRRAIVVDDDRHVLGIITDGDLLQRSRQGSEPGLLERLRGLVIGQQHGASSLPAADDTAAELMTTPVITVTTATPLDQALRLMLDHQIKRLPVTDAEGRLVGLLGRASLLNGLLSAAAS